MAKHSIFLSEMTEELINAVLLYESEDGDRRYKSFSAFVNECIVQHCGNLGYQIQPAKIIKIGDK